MALLAAPVAARAYTYCFDPADDAAVQAAFRALQTCGNQAPQPLPSSGAGAQDSPGAGPRPTACEAENQRLIDLLGRHCRPAYCVKPDEQAGIEASVHDVLTCAVEQAKRLALTPGDASDVVRRVMEACQPTVMKGVQLYSSHCDPPANPGVGGAAAEGLVFGEGLMERGIATGVVRRARAASKPATAAPTPGAPG